MPLSAFYFRMQSLCRMVLARSSSELDQKFQRAKADAIRGLKLDHFRDAINQSI